MKAGGPTVKNVSGYDLARLIVGSLGTLAFIGEVVLRTRPIAATSRCGSRVGWTRSTPWPGCTDRRRSSGTGDHVGVHRGPSRRRGRRGGAHRLPTTPPDRRSCPPHRWSLRPEELRALPGRAADTGRFVAEVGVGIVHAERPPPDPVLDPVVLDLHRRVRTAFDPTGRLNPGRVPW